MESSNGQLSCSPGADSVDYAPSPNTCSLALTRANQLRVQALLRQLLERAPNSRRLDCLRMLGKTMRQLEHRISWLTQVDFLETLERLLAEESERHQESDWRIINETNQLLSESLSRLPFELDEHSIRQLFSSVIQNLGHQRSEVRRSSLLLINFLINERRQHFQLLLKLFIDYGLSNYRNPEAQRGAILSLPLLMSERAVEGEDLLPLMKALTSELLVDSNSKLFYSIYLALQRLQLTLGEQRFALYLRQCKPEAVLLYKQTASRNNSLTGDIETLHLPARKSASSEQVEQSESETKENESIEEENINSDGAQPKQVTFEESEPPTELKLTRGQHQQQSVESEPEQEQEQEALNSDDTSNGSLFSADSGEEATRIDESRAKKMIVSQSSVSSTCSSQANSVDPAHYMNAAALDGRPLSDFERIHHHLLDCSSEGLAINDLSTCCTPTMDLGQSHELRFGIFPRQLVSSVLDSRRPNRLESMEEMMCIVRESPINHLAILMTYFDQFLDHFLGRLMGAQSEQSAVDYKLELVAIDMIETIVIKTKVSTMNYVRPMVSLLMRSIGHQRSVFVRQNGVRVIHKMMACLPPQYVIDALFEHKHSKQTQVREEVVNRVSGAVLEYDSSEFNLTKLCYHILPMLADHQASVRLASLECIATLAHALGPERIGSLLTAAEAVQTGCDYDGLLDAINARLLRRTLPRSNADGSIRFVIKPFLNLANSNFHQEHQAADVRWVLEAPSSHQHAHSASVSPSAGDWHPHHRLGVYSPPTLSKRRSSVAAGQLAQLAAHHSSSESLDSQSHAQLHHHHHHHHHHHQHLLQQQQQQQQQEKSRRENLHEQMGANEPSKSSLADSQQHQQQSKGRRMSVGSNSSKRDQANNNSQPKSNKTSEINQKTTGSMDLSNSKRRGSVQEPTAASNSSQRVAPEARAERSSISNLRRSNSQESTSSTDTNKLLFQFYLGKFKESLRENSLRGSIDSALPSDSLIYTDTALAYSLSQHKTRQQQTSFDYDTDSVGRIPESPKSKLEQRQRSAEDELSGRQNRHQQQQQREQEVAGSSSECESPLTVMENSNQNSRGVGVEEESRERTPPAPLERNHSGERRRNSLKTTDGEPNVSRRKSISTKKQRSDESERPNNLSAKEVAPEVAPRRRSISVEQNRESNNWRSEERSERKSIGEFDSGERRGKRREKGAGLIRQGASECAEVTEGNQMGVSRQELDEEAQLVQSREDSGKLPEEESEMKRQESLSSTMTADSLQSAGSQRDCSVSDHSTQTNPEAHKDEHESGRRESRRRKNGRRRSSSKRREEEREKAELEEEEEELEMKTRPRASKSQPPAPDRHLKRHPNLREQHQAAHTARSGQLTSSFQQHEGSTRRAVSVSPSVANSQVNIRHILENVAQVEGAFQEPQLAYKVAMDALESPCWSTKVEGILALIRLCAHHHQIVVGHLHEIVNRVAGETKNLRSTVARSAIFALGDFCHNLKRSIEPELDSIVQALLHKSIENTAFIRDDIRQALGRLLDSVTQWRLALALMHHGANHKNAQVRRMSGLFLAQLVERMGPAKCLVGARDISGQLIPAAAKFAQDNSPQTRYYGRLILSRIMHHGAFERLLRKSVAPNLYRSTVGVLESIKRRGAGEPPADP